MGRKKAAGGRAKPPKKASKAAAGTSATSGDENLSYLQSLIDSIEDGLVVVDRDLRIVKANRNFLTRVARTEVDVVGRPCYEVLHGGSRECLLGGGACPSRQVFDTGRPAEATATLQREKGPPQILQIHSSPVFDKDNQIHQAVEVIRDITETKHLEARLARAERYAAISRIAANVAHEINNPMAAVATCVEGLERRVRELSAAPADQRQEILEYLEIIKQSAQRCKAMAERLLSYSSQTTLRREPVDLNEVLRNVCRLLEFDIGREGKKIVLHLAPGPIIVLGDRAQLSEVYLNLLMNAVDATEAGDEISVTTLDSGDKVLVAVKDSGRGIETENLKKIFEPFFTTKELGKGTGLGLAICKEIVQQHRGTIWAESEPGTGSTFFTELPLTRTPANEPTE